MEYVFRKRSESKLGEHSERSIVLGERSEQIHSCIYFTVSVQTVKKAYIGCINN